MVMRDPTVETDRIDLADPDNWVPAVPHQGFDWLRDHEPVSYHVKRDGTDFYALVRSEDGNSQEKAQQAAMEMYMYWEWLSHQAERERNDDLIQALLDAELDGGEKLTSMDIDAFLLLLVVAGNETTRNLIAGGMRTLFENSEQWELLQEHPELLVTGVEEMLRYISPVMYFRRTATRDLDVSGVTIP